ncbi:hypothetical protein ACFLTH_17230 [Bacteroidota bacterium]
MAFPVQFSGFSMNEVYMVFGDLFTKPFQIKDMTWIILPVIATIIVMELYYAMHKDEQLGWNTATANSLVLIFVSMDLLRFLFSNKEFTFNPSNSGFSATLLVFFVLIEGIILVTINFKHKLPEFLAFRVSSQLSINLTAYAVVVLTYARIPLTLSAIIAVIVFFVLMNILFLVMRTFIPSKT